MKPVVDDPPTTWQKPIRANQSKSRVRGHLHHGRLDYYNENNIASNMHPHAISTRHISDMI
jgi:hypothetical protein